MCFRIHLKNLNLLMHIICINRQQNFNNWNNLNLKVEN